MNKNEINKLIPYAYEALAKTKIVENGCISKTFRGQISTFGAAITMGSLVAAIAFFNDKGSASVDRAELMKAICMVLVDSGKIELKNENIDKDSLYNYVLSQKSESLCKENILNASIAIKLAMNLYELKG